MVTERLVVLGGLDVEARRLFAASASSAIETAKVAISLGCGLLDALDEPTLGMLVMIVRFAQRRGKSVVLDMLSARARSDLEQAGVSHMFAWPV